MTPDTKPPAATHAYLGVWHDEVQAIAVDLGDKGTADFVSGIIKTGGVVHRVTIEQARGAMYQPWSLFRAAVSHPHP